jgi:hypothetical protein
MLGKPIYYVSTKYELTMQCLLWLTSYPISMGTVLPCLVLVRRPPISGLPNPD